MFEKFTEGAIKVIMLSQEEARRIGHNFVGTEQLLLGIIGQRQGIGAHALRKSKVRVTLKKARREVEKYIGRGNGFVASEIPFTPRAKRVLEMAVQEGKDLGQNFVGTEHILLALIGEKDGIAILTLRRLHVDTVELKKNILDLIDENQDDILRPLTESEKIILSRETGEAGKTATLEEFSDNITEDAMKGRLDPVIGRDEEILSVIRVLARRRKNNPVLMGEPGVGKTAVAEGLAQLIISADVPPFLEGNVLMALDLGTLLAGTKYRGEFEERLKKIVEEVQRDPSIILVIDEIHTLVGAGAAEGAVDAANILKPALARGKFKCIGATTIEEYRKYIERDAALERRFNPVQVDEPSVGVTIEILRGLRKKFEEHHRLSYEDKAVEQSAILTDKFIADRFLPDKAIDVLDEAGSRVRLENKNLPEPIKLMVGELQDTIREKNSCIREEDFKTAGLLLEHEMEVRLQVRILKKAHTIRQKAGIIRTDFDLVNEEDIAAVISGWTGIPMTKISDSESKKLLSMEDTLHERLIGQHEAIVSVSKAVRRARLGLRNPNRPIASFLFAGPTGVGKTELTKALAEYLFGADDSMVRLDMSEYMEKHTVAKLIGSPPGYVGYNEGGQLTEAVRTTPYTVVLFDEIEKAHPDVFNLLLQILDDGRLTDSKGRTIDFKNTLIIMTSNIGAKIIEKESGIVSQKMQKDLGYLGMKYRPEPEVDETLYRKISVLVNEELKNYFRPEFLNRIDEIIIFRHLNRENITKIFDIMLKQLEERIKEKELSLDVTSRVKEIIIDAGYDPAYGARPLRRAMMRLLEDNLARELLSRTMHPGTLIIVDAPDWENKDIKITIDFTNVHHTYIENDPDYLEGENCIDYRRAEKMEYIEKRENYKKSVS